MLGGKLTIGTCLNTGGKTMSSNIIGGQFSQVSQEKKKMAAFPNAGNPGWTGNTVLLKKLDKQLAETVRATVKLEPKSGTVSCDDKDLLEQWNTEGIFGRQQNGRVYPKDGQKFLDELPFVYKSAYFWAEPEKTS